MITFLYGVLDSLTLITLNCGLKREPNERLEDK